jgi:hypothetical protein
MRVFITPPQHKSEDAKIVGIFPNYLADVLKSRPLVRLFTEAHFAFPIGQHYTVDRDLLKS